jgi:DNA-3-methyladenine glycosylase I
MKKRCEWAKGKLMEDYHDNEWGVPVHDDRKLFEFLVLEGAQAGLSWSTILNRREFYKKAFDNFDVKKISKYNERKIKELLNNEGIIRNKLKINSVVNNAKKFIEVQKEFGSFDRYLWKFVKNKQIKNHFRNLREIPPNTKISEELSKDLKSRGFGFVGSTVCYAFMQAMGLVNDHTKNCFRYRK